MMNFEHYTPTKIVFGKETEKEVGRLVKEQGCSKVLVHYGGQSAKKSGLLDKVLASLDEAGVSYTELGGVVPNPRLSKVYEGIELARKENVDFLLAVGGGSVIDSSKAIAYGIANPDHDVWDFYSGKALPEECAPVGVVLTIAAAGSETSNSSVITKEEGWLKWSCNNDLGRPRFAVMNPELTCTLPAYQTASGGTDIMMHTLERYLQNNKPMDITDGMAEALLRNMIRYLPLALAEPDNYEARAEIMWCGSLSHIGLMQLGATRGDWSCHQLEHELGGMFDVAHGAGLAAVWATWARYVYRDNTARFANLARTVFGFVSGESDEDAAVRGIDAMEEFFRSINMPTSLTELGIKPTDEQLHELAVKCSRNGARRIGTDGIRGLDEADMETIYRAAL